jgi:hypothetical protein
MNSLAFHLPPEMRRVHVPLLAITFAAVLVGIYARFKGLGTWPLGIDEYYTARTVQNVLRTGLPEYACGGYYARGLLVQYLGALLQLGGMSPELSLRLIAAVSSLAVLPAAYILGRRAGGITTGLLTVTVLALSVWEVEMARFARMYAPFQAVFVSYVIFFLRYTLDKEARALWSMIVLSVVGALVWEGGVFLAALNLLPPIVNHAGGRLSRRDWRYLAGTALLVPPLFLLATNNLRMYSREYPFPPGWTGPATSHFFVSGLKAGTAPLTTLPAHPFWLVLALVPLLCFALALRWVWGFRSRWITALGLLAALGAAAAHQFLLFGVIILLLLLLRLLGWRELFSRASWPFGAAVAVSAAFWIAYGLATSDWRANPDQSLPQTVALLGYEFVRFPDFALEIARPWAKAVPILGLALFVLITAACIRVIRNEDAELTAERVILIILVLLLLAASASHPPRHETRYLFFLYPLAVIIALMALARASAMVVRAASWQPQAGAIAAAALGLAGFALTEDFQPYHLLNVDTASINFRIDMKPEVAAHYYARSDVRAAAQWLAQNTSESDTVISSYQSLEFYYPHVDYFYMESTDRRFSGWSCRGGTVERWGNTPLLYTIPSLQAQFTTGKRVFYVLDRRNLEKMPTELQRRQHAVAWTRHGIAIVAFAN